jgi:hypothetical protein
MLLFASAAANSFSAGNATSDSLFNLAVDMTSVTTNMATPSAGGTLTINSQDLSYYDYVVKQGNQTLTAFTAADWFTVTPDTRSAWIVVNGNLTINSGITFTPTVRKLFTCIYVAGNLQLDGTISMSARGANHSGTGSSNGLVIEKDIRIITGTYSSVVNPQIPATGGAAGKPGGSPTNGGTGGGGNGGSSGTSGTAFTGGVGGGAPGTYVSVSVARGGKGADSYEHPDGNFDNNTYGSGAGNPGGGGSRGTASTGTGGTLIVFVRGTLSGSGSFTSIGAAGGSGSSIGPAQRFSHGGGGTGGGSITIIRGSDTSSTTVTTTGGAGGPGESTGTGSGYSDPGGTGGTGSGRKLTF